MISVFRLSDFQISGSAISSRKNNHGDGVYKCYYFETQSNGRRGRLYKNTTVEGYKVNEKGQWTQNGKVMTRTK